MSGNVVAYTNGNIITMNPAQPRADAMAVRDGRILVIGSRSTVEAAIEDAATLEDLDGKTVVPGFNDCHMHVLPYGMQLGQVDLTPSAVESIADLCRVLAQSAAITRSGDWVRGRGYNHDLLAEKRHPTRSDLDQASLVHPVVVSHTSGHVLSCNGRALQTAGIDRNTVSPPGGEIEHEADGEPTGVLKETAMPLLVRAIPPPSVETARDAILLAMTALAKDGITSASDASTGHDQPAGREMAAYRMAVETGELRGRITLMPQIIYVAPPGSEDVAAPTDYDVGDRPDWLRIGATKIFSDGAITTRTAALRRPYQDSAGRGLPTWDQETLTSMVGRAHTAGWQIAIHAMGDHAIEMTLNAYGAAQNLHSRVDARHRIEHCSLPDHELRDRIRSLAVVPVVQPELLARFGDSYVAGLGIDRAANAMPVGWLRERGVPVAFSSDRPVVSGSPLFGISSAILRRTAQGVVLGSGHAVAAEDALRAYTEGSALATFSEQDKGYLAPGYLADFAVLDQDVTKIQAHEITDIRILKTVVGGTVVYQA
jgi:predicted amidohydrolase YtcJ